ncbi:MAG: TrkA family potassium uptake protein [Gorillibacterium sp.]|nr:TrkA family potassium uptake protein [Gorillibacterium sp.]
MKKQYGVIGMGRFGSSIAQSLTKLGFDVLAVDSDEARVQEISQSVARAVQADPTDEEALRALGMHDFEVVVVAIGQDIQANILTTLILKELGVKKLIVKAQNELHGNVLKKIGADKVIFPERDMGLRVAHALISPNVLDFIELSDDHSIVEIKATSLIIGRSLRELDIRAKHNCNVMALKQNGKMNITPGPDDQILESDILIVVGHNDNLIRFEKFYAE